MAEEIKAGGRDYLLTPMRKQELAVLDEVLDRVKIAVEVVLTKGVSAAMNEFNRRPDSEKDSRRGEVAEQGSRFHTGSARRTPGGAKQNFAERSETYEPYL